MSSHVRTVVPLERRLPWITIPFNSQTVAGAVDSLRIADLRSVSLFESHPPQVSTAALRCRCYQSGQEHAVSPRWTKYVFPLVEGTSWANRPQTRIVICSVSVRSVRGSVGSSPTARTASVASRRYRLVVDMVSWGMPPGQQGQIDRLSAFRGLDLSRRFRTQHSRPQCRTGVLRRCPRIRRIWCRSEQNLKYRRLRSPTPQLILTSRVRTGGFSPSRIARGTHHRRDRSTRRRRLQSRSPVSRNRRTRGDTVSRCRRLPG